MKRYLTAREVCAALDISAGTLYSYVSRGLIRSETISGSRRERRYSAEDVTRMIAKRQNRRDPEKTAREALRWGMPVMESGLTLITEDRHYYRGEDAIGLAQSATFEQVMMLLWGQDGAEAEGIVNQTSLVGIPIPPSNSAIHRMVYRLTTISDVWRKYEDKPRLGQGLFIMKNLLAAALGAPPKQRISYAAGYARSIAETWGGDAHQLRPLVEAALILCADHELNASAFAVRVAASTDAMLPAALIAGMATLSGMKHGGAVSVALDLFRRLETTDQPEAEIAQMIDANQRIAGFGHRLYPIGDPRAYLLLEMIRAAKPDSSVMMLADSIREAVFDQLGLYPNIDFALATLQRAFELPSQSGIRLFALGRTAGWIAHAWEQYDTHTLIRPRAHYSGEKPTLS